VTRTRSVADRYLSLPYHSVIEPVSEEEGGGWYGRVLELPGCSTVGASAEEVARELEVVKKLWLEKAIASEENIPEPYPTEYSGRLTLRLPNWLHEQISLAAATQRVSVNSFVVSELTRSVRRGQPSYAILFRQMTTAIARNLSAEWPDRIFAPHRFPSLATDDKDPYTFGAMSRGGDL